MNSLLQTLFHIKAFRFAVFELEKLRKESNGSKFFIKSFQISNFFSFFNQNLLLLGSNQMNFLLCIMYSTNYRTHQAIFPKKPHLEISQNLTTKFKNSFFFQFFSNIFSIFHEIFLSFSRQKVIGASIPTENLVKGNFF